MQIVRLLLWLCLVPLVSSAETREAPCRAYVGTYTGQGSQGIYTFDLDPQTGQAGPVSLAAATENPSFLALDRKGEFLYAVNELDLFQGAPTGSVSVFAIARDSGTLEPVQQIPSHGAAPAHLSVDASNRFLFVANYNGGNVAVFPIERKGRLGPHSALAQESGSSVNPKRQSGPHAHFIQAARDNRFVLSANLGLDKLFVYRFDASTGSLAPGDPPFVRVEPGAGPRHVAFGPLDKYVYVLNELGSTVAAYSFNVDSGTLQHVQTLSTLPKDFTGTNTAAEIQVDAKGRFLYVSNRGHDSLGVFSIHPDSGTLKSVQWVSSGGKTPRHFTFEPSGKWLLAANQDSNTIKTFQVDPESGRLSAMQGVIQAPYPVFVGFVPPAEVIISTEVAAVLPSAQEEVGNDPTRLRSRFELGDEYLNNSGGPDWHLLTARIDGALNPKLAFRLDIPYMFLIPRGYPHEKDRGLADVMFRSSAVLKKTARAGFTGVCDFWFDTAESVDFGRGKYSAAPGLAVALMNPYKDVMLTGFVHHKFSFAGDPSRTDISRTKLQVTMDKSFSERYWLILDPMMYVDWVNHGRTAAVLELETGARMGQHWSLWARPGIGLWGQEISGGYNSYLQAGVRYMFGKPVREQILKQWGLLKPKSNR